MPADPDADTPRPAPGPPIDHAAPIDAGERLGSLDAVRGVAVLGILAMNIRNFGLPLGEFDNPRWPRHDAAQSTLAPADFWTWLTANVFFEDKMITIFGLLFGAGVVIFGDRAARAAAAAGAGPWHAAALHYRRMFWLLIIGLLHAYFLWYGDILNTYALCGLLLWPMRRLRPGTLIGLGVLLLLVSILWRIAPPLWEMLTRDAPPLPRPPSATRRIMAEAARTEEAAYRGGWTDLFLWRAHMNTAWHFLAGLTFSLWRSLGHMLIGMGLMRLGLFAASPRALPGLAMAGYGLGLTLTLIGVAPTVAEVLHRAPDLGPARALVARLAFAMRSIGALGVALGHIALILLARNAAARAGAAILALPRRALEAVGRMALTNYLTHTLICILIFDGWAAAQWDRWPMAHLYALVAAIWTAQLILSPLWLRAFRFGPCEWAWRCLTYWRLEPIRR